jgi:hypothetical protein
MQLSELIVSLKKNILLKVGQIILSVFTAQF